MRIVLATAILAMLAWPAAAKPPADPAQAILQVHNAERAAIGVPAVAWSDEAAAHAKAWAEKLAETGKMRHSPVSDRPGEGENLWIGSAGAYTPAEMAEAWAAEKSHFKYGTYPNLSRDGQVVGHYSQMVWRNTTAIGCAIVRSGKWDILVCRYAPPGNFIGAKPY
jgi:hypothetical protein